MITTMWPGQLILRDAATSPKLSGYSVTMRPIFPRLLILLALSLPVSANAQVFKKGVPSRSRVDPSRLEPPKPVATPMETPRGPIRDLVNEPWLSPTGERLVAIVEDRMLTKPELEARVSLLLGEVPTPTTADAKLQLEDEKIVLSRKIMEDWVANAALSIEANRRGHKPDEAEVDEALSKLAQESEIAADKVESRIKFIGIPQEQLRAEIRDGLAIEDFILSIVRSNNRDYFQKVFEQDPSAFLLPPRAQVFRVFRFLPPGITSSQKEKMLGDLESLRKELKRRKPDFAALEAKSNAEIQLVIGNMGWVSAGSTVSDSMGKLYSTIFSLDVGETSEVFYAGNGYHIVHILEREEGSQPTLDAAMPQIENYLFEKIKRATFEAIKPHYKIQMNSGGLSKWREARPGESGPKRASSSSSRMSPPPPSSSPSRIESQLKPAAPAEPSIDLDAIPLPN